MCKTENISKQYLSSFIVQKSLRNNPQEFLKEILWIISDIWNIKVIQCRIISGERIQRCPYKKFSPYILWKNILEKEFARGITHFPVLVKNILNVLWYAKK